MTSKFALVIANTDYQDENLARLTAPGRDAEDFARVLREPQLAGFDDVQVLLNESDEKTRRAIARFFTTNRRSDDLLLLYFSGHGIRNDQGQLFLAASDTEIGLLDATGIPSEFVSQSMTNSRSHRQVLILDCCNSGAFDRGTKKAPNSMGTAEAFGSGFGRIVLTATDAVQFAWEGDKVIGNTQNSVFTHFLIEGLKGEADRDGDGRISVDELYDYAYEQVIKRTPKQTPSKWSYKQQGEIYLRENLKSREAKPASLPVETLEMLNDTSVRIRDLGVQDLAKLLAGKHLGLTHAAEDKLREISVNDDSLSLRKTASDILAQANQGTTAGQISAVPTEDKKVDRNESAKKSAQKAKQKKTGGFGFPFMIATFFVVGVFLINRWLSSSTPALTETPIATTASTQASTLSVATETEAPPLGIGSTMTGTDGMTMLYVPAGESTMGSENGDLDERPIHKVNLDAFWIDQTEVTNKMYSLCVAAGVCNQPANTGSATHSRYYGNSEFESYPVIYVDWNMAKTYCEWAGRELPTEAQWEKAARGMDANIYPWGNTFDGRLVNFCDANCSSAGANKSFNDGYADVSPVGSYPAGQSTYNAYDMAGNVWEWVNDWYDVYPGGYATASSNFGQKYRVLRGGSWFVNTPNIRSSDRYWVDLSDSFNYFVGFRCAGSQ